MLAVIVYRFQQIPLNKRPVKTDFDIITPEDILDKIEELIGGQVKDNFSVLGFTPRTKKILENAYLEAKKLGSNYIGTEHLLVGMMKETDSIAIRILVDLEVNPDEM